MSRPLITIFEQIHQSGIDELRKFADIKLAFGASRRQHIELSSISDAIIVKSAVQVDDELMRNAPSLRVIARAGTGVDNIDVAEADRLKIRVLSVPTGNSVSAAEFTILQILSLCRRMPEVIAFSNRKDYRRHLLEGRELKNLQVGLVGMGNVGFLVFERLKSFGCKVLAFDPYSEQLSKFSSQGGTICESFDDLISNVDVLSFHCRLTPDNYHMMDEIQFNQVKPGLLLINTARANLINQDALLRALDSGKVLAASLDVIYPELPFDAKPNEHNYYSDILKNKSAFVTPHIGASTVDAQKRISLDISNQISGILN